MYIEASSPRVAGDNAKLELFVPGDGEPFCLRFYYHMYGFTMGNLIVFSGNVAVFSESGNYGIYWIEAERTISSNKTVSVVPAPCNHRAWSRRRRVLSKRLNAFAFINRGR